MSTPAPEDLPTPKPLPPIPEELTRESAEERRLRSLGRSEVHGLGGPTFAPPPRLGATGQLVGMGVEFVAAGAMFAAAGYGIDLLLSSKPWGLVVGLVLGLTIGFARLIRQAMSATRGSGPQG